MPHCLVLRPPRRQTIPLRGQEEAPASSRRRAVMREPAGSTIAPGPLGKPSLSYRSLSPGLPGPRAEGSPGFCMTPGWASPPPTPC
ncbi:sodium/potassium-transporting ATPase subunit gamma isoform X6 [Eubalaena glacialis]|uniref:sodium/potassium-transporting ATPase subunit gamma isoform X6 n=1 Tax=Eubalaena glacialis TaxID=27606 RepID=UPI002A59F119|nr:sodium/potassium-transporting ATPase subunit gamma isoform X6 [Eubalaena glacialis]